MRARCAIFARCGLLVPVARLQQAPVDSHPAPGRLRGANMSADPWFSVVISSYNRSEILRRCLDSVFPQSFRDFEIVLVDDGSKDDTLSMLRSMTDERLRVIEHPVNRGLCAARDTGARNARGRWIITLDSDHALREEALENLYQRTKNAPSELGVVGSRYLWDTGMITPRFVPDGIIDYGGRIRWMAEEAGTDYLCCYRRELYGRDVVWPAERRGPLDGLFQLNLARATKLRFDPDVIALEYSDAENSQTRSRGMRGARTLMNYARDMAWMFDVIMRDHGEAIRQNAPALHASHTRQAAMFHFIAGSRAAGARYIARYLASKPASLLGWGVLSLGMLDGRLLAWAKSQRTL